MHVFHHKQGYIHIEDGSPFRKDSPNHSFILWQGRWYKRNSAHKVRQLIVSQVPKQHRLQLRLMHIKQPEK